MHKGYFRLCDTSSVIIKKMLLLTISLCIILSGTTIAYAGGKVESKVQISGIPQRIVVFPLFAEEMLLEMIGPDRIVYVGHEYWENAEAYTPTMELTKHIKGNYWQNSDIGEIRDLKPDLVVLLKEFFSDYTEVFPELEQAKIPVLFLDPPKTIQDIKNTLFIIGEAVSASEKAAQMAQDMEAALAQITQLVSNIPEEKRVHAIYCGIDFPYEDSEEYYYFPNNFPLVARIAGVINASGSDTYYEHVSNEGLTKWDPDLITVSPFYLDTDGSLYDIGDDYLEESITYILNNQKLSGITAIRIRNVHPLSLYESQFIVKSVADLARLAYPDLFSEKK